MIGWYAWLKPATLQWIPDMATSGANTVHLVDVGPAQFEPAGKALEVARNCGMKVTLSLDRRLLDHVRPDVPASYTGIFDDVSRLLLYDDRWHACFLILTNNTPQELKTRYCSELHFFRYFCRLASPRTDLSGCFAAPWPKAIFIVA